MKTETKLRAAERLYIAAAAFITILICSKSSPLYPFNDWVDANCFLTVGRSMLHRLLPYRDLFEQKGPLLYILHALAALISEQTFLGVFFLEVIACLWTLTSSCKLLRGDCGKAALFIVPLISVLICSSRAFSHGDSAEELCLPLLLSSFCTGLSSVRSDRPLTQRESFTIGVLSGCVLWIKFSLLGFYAGSFIVPAVIICRRDGFRGLLRSVGAILLGAAAASVPILLIFAVSGSLGDLFTVYFYDNLFLYSSDKSVWANLLGGLRSVWRNLPAVPVSLILTTLILVWKKRTRELAYLLLTLCGAFMLMFGGGRAYQYYPLALAVFLPFAASVTFSALRAPAEKHLRLPGRALPALCTAALAANAALCGLLSRNTYLMKYKKADMPQYRFAEVMKETPGADLLNYGFLDGGFYTVSGTLPTCRFFCQTNLPYSEMKKQQQYYVENGLTDYIVMRTQKGELPHLPEKYELVAEASFPYYSQDFTYYLLRLRD
ncbi:MAG: hypothetical protein IJM44_01370 [Ruminococcus sp.]|nr:hypothetical protein [Ruminococcus sp.]